MAQLKLFEEPGGPEVRDAGPDPIEAVRREAADLAAALPDHVLFGTSSWAFPGWRGLVYSRAIPDRALAREGLAEYARHPLLRTVGIDRSYYGPIPDLDLQRYARLLPGGFGCVLKAPAAMTSFARIGPDGRSLPERNPDYLDVGRFATETLEPLARSFAGHTGAILLQFPPAPGRLRPDPDEFARRLDGFLSALAGSFPFAVEVRDRNLLTPRYAEVLARHGAAHTYNYWSAMPLPFAQSRLVPVDSAPFLVIRLLMAPGTRYEERREEMRPFDRIVAPDPDMRDEVVRLTGEAARAGRRRVYILVNNKAEGSAPLTIRALAEALVSPPAASSSAPPRRAGG